MTDKKLEFGELKKITMSDTWKSEPQGFTPWLYDNIGALGETLGMTLRAKEMEFRIGRYYLDLLAEDGDGRKVAIENQFGDTDHSHLGQLLTYAVGCEADVLIWVTEGVNDEHRMAMEWLNRQNNTNVEFYLVQVDVLQIDDSRPAYQFVPVVTANKWQKEANQQASKKSPEDIACGEYFSQFIEELGKKEPSLTLARQHRDQTRYRFFSCGVRNHRWVYAHRFYDDNTAAVYLHFDGALVADVEMVCEELLARKESIKGIWDGWDKNWEDWDSYSIGVFRNISFSDTEESLAKHRAWAIDQMCRMVKAIPPAMLQEIADKLDSEKSAE